MATKKAKPVKISEFEELEGGDILDQMIDTGIKPRGDKATERAQDLVKTFVGELRACFRGVR